MQLIILGMHRSGTSVLARLLNMMGAYFGPEGSSLGANEDNPKGFWERKDVRHLNEFVTHSAGCDWDRVSTFDVETLPESVKGEFNRRARKIVLELDSHRPWLLKEPRLCLLFELWREFLEVPICIHIYRSPLEVAQSLENRDGISIKPGIALWEFYNQSALNASKGLPRIAIPHNQLISEPELAVSSMHEQLQELGAYGLRMPSSREINAFVRTDLYRNRAETDSPDQMLNDAQTRLYSDFLTGSVLEKNYVHLLSDECLPLLTQYERESRKIQTSGQEEVVSAGQRAENSALSAEKVLKISPFMRWLHVIEFRIGSWSWQGGRKIVGNLATVLNRLEGLRSGYSGRHRDCKLIHDSGLFDTRWYLSEYPDVERDKMDPIEHFALHGWKEKRNPGPGFDTDWYLLKNPDVVEAGVNPLVHYIVLGRDEKRQPKP